MVLVPFNVLLALLLPERGIRYHHSYRWLLLGLAEALFVLWVAAAGRSPMLSGLAWHRVLDFWLLRSPPTPLAGRLMFAAAFVAAEGRPASLELVTPDDRLGAAARKEGFALTDLPPSA